MVTMVIVTMVIVMVMGVVMIGETHPGSARYLFSIFTKVGRDLDLEEQLDYFNGVF